MKKDSIKIAAYIFFLALIFPITISAQSPGYQNNLSDHLKNLNPNPIEYLGLRTMQNNIVDTVIVLNLQDSLRYIYTFSPEGYLVQEFIEKWVSFNWTKSGLVKFALNPAGKILSELDSKWNGSQWIDTIFIKNTYNSLGLQDTLYRQEADLSHTLQKNFLRIYTYNSDSTVSSIVEQIGVLNTWAALDRQTFIYDINKNKTSYLSEEWDYNQLQWIANNRSIFTYNFQNQELTNTIQVWNTSSSSWVNGTLFTHTYNSNNKLSTEAIQTWDIVKLQWVNNQDYVYSYTTDNILTTLLNQYWDKFLGQWANGVLYTYTFNSNDDLLSVLNQNWNTVTSKWENNNRKIFTYDVNNLLISYSFDYWGITDWNPGNGPLSMNVGTNNTVRNYFGYSIIIRNAPFTGIKENKSLLPDEYSLSQNFPNPFNPNTIIRYNLRSASNIKISIYNSIGQLVKNIDNKIQPAGSHEITFMGNSLPSGVYLYHLQANSVEGTQINFVSTKKMILIK